MIRTLVCTSSADVRLRLRGILAEQPEIAIAGEAADAQEAADLAVALTPDAALVDACLPPLGGAEATRQLLELLPCLRVVGLVRTPDRRAVGGMQEAGAAGYCVEDAPLWELERALVGASEPLVRLAQGLAKSANAQGASELVAREVAELTGAGCAVFLAAPDVGLSPGVVLRAFRERALAPAGPDDLAELARHGLPAIEALAAPLVDDGQTLGALLAAMPPAAMLEIDAELLCAIAGLAASAFANERRIALTHDEARRDSLTGLPNRRAFEERLAELLVLQDERPVGLALFDVDGFKEVNDRHGHQAGDDVLRQLGRVFSRSVRASDEVFRVGGDELAVLVPDGGAAACRVANRIRRALAGHERGRLPTVSAGVAGTPDDGHDEAELLRRADLALYAAKRGGGDRVLPCSAAADAAPTAVPAGRPHPGARILLVDDETRMRTLLRTTLEVIDVEIEEAASVAEARRIVAARLPDAVVLDVGLPGPSGLELCRELKGDARTRHVGIVVLTGGGAELHDRAREAGADAFLRKPFSPLDLLTVVERLLAGLYEGPFRVGDARPPAEQLVRYAHDLRRLLDLERVQRSRVQQAYRETVDALVSALEAKDTGTREHSRRVQHYALALARALEPSLLDRPSVEFGFLLHDVGKIAIPDRILNKPDALTPGERRVVQTHTVVGEQLLADVALLQGEGLQIVRHHHERWDGRGYPDGLAGAEIPLPARIFAVADAVDAITSDRPYREAAPWADAVAEIVAESGGQFDPDVVAAFLEREAELRAIYERFAAAEPVALSAALAGAASPPRRAGAAELPPWLVPAAGGLCDPLAGEDDPWLPGDLAPPVLLDMPPDVPDDGGNPVSFTRMLLASVTVGAAIWTGLAGLLWLLLAG
jgi:diguanylate cyclase (GGDEF)-like protein